MQYPSSKALLQELFGDLAATAIFCLPNRLGFLADSLPKGVSLTVDHIIDQHTNLPFFSAFLPPERIQLIREDMTTGNGAAAYMRSGIMASSIKSPLSLRFCSSCLKEDEVEVEEGYWHRAHQLPGITICHLHGILLESSTVSMQAGRNSLLFISAREATSPIRPAAMAHKTSDNEVMLKLAREANWLLEHPQQGHSSQNLHKRYLRLLIERGLATHTGSIHAEKLLGEFGKFYSPRLLNQLNCEFSGKDQNKTNWLLRLVRRPKHSQHPLYHLLLMQFLGYTVDKFFQLPEELNFFGEGPWPCLNPASEHRGEGKISACEISYRGKNHRPTGTFSCECGFVYARTGPDETPENRYRISKMKAFGHVWEDDLRHLWVDSALSISGIAARLEVDPLTVRRHAERLQLAASGSKRRALSLNPTLRLKAVSSMAEHTRKRRRHRALWLEAMKGRPKPRMKSLRGSLPRTYAWLIQNDAAWLMAHRPKPSKRVRAATSVDWGRRDLKLALAVRESASRLKSTPGSPIRVTKTAIGRGLGQITLLRQKIHKLPLTAEALDEVVESQADFAIRRVKRAAELFSQEGAQPGAWKLIKRANVRCLMPVAGVADAVNAALLTLEETIYAKAG